VLGIFFALKNPTASAGFENNQLKYIVMEISSVVWLHIYPVLIGVCTVHSAE
jgi:hypothetical protein